LSNTRIFFITDIHGSEICFRKFLNAGAFYKAKVLILGGDITGKMIVPIIEQSDSTFRCIHLGREIVLKGKEDAARIEKDLRDSGLYPYYTKPNEVDELSAKPELVKSLFIKLMVERVQRWMKLAEEKLKSSGIKCYISPGNDDVFDIDEALNASTYVNNPEGKVVDIDGEHEMITMGFTNHTPWNSPREADEAILAEKIEGMARNVKQMDTAIFNLHVPPIGTAIDQAPELDEQLRPLSGGAQMISAGSAATRQAIERDQPLLGLHGHIHESRGVVKIGRTLCANPGSEYGAAILRGILCDLQGNKVKSYLLTSG
jgi:uncharacterized protein